MDYKEFQEKAIRTESVASEINISQFDKTVFANSLQAWVALSEVLDIYKKHIFYGREINHNDILEHLQGVRNYGEEAMFAAQDQMHIPSEPTETIDIDIRLFHALLGTITEHGELAIALSQGMNSGELDLVNICEELGDSDWYKGLFFEATGIDWGTVREMIIKKLEIRFRDKIFKAEEANERDLEEERKLLEASIKEAVDDYHRKQNV